METMDLITRIVVLATDLGLHIADSSKSFRNSVCKTYNLSWLKNKRLRHVLDTEFFIWTWTMATYYGAVHCLSQGMSKEASLYQSIFEDYFSVVLKDRDTFEIFHFWKKYIDDVANISEEDYQGRYGYSERILEKLTDMLSLKTLRYIHEEIVELDIDALNETWGEHIIAVQQDLEFVVYRIVDVINQYFTEIDESSVEVAFEAIRNKEPVKSLIAQWQASEV